MQHINIDLSNKEKAQQQLLELYHESKKNNDFEPILDVFIRVLLHEILGLNENRKKIQNIHDQIFIEQQIFQWYEMMSPFFPVINEISNNMTKNSFMRLEEFVKIYAKEGRIKNFKDIFCDFKKEHYE